MEELKAMSDEKINLEQKLVRYCAPVLAGLKIANLFRYQPENEELLQKELGTVSEKLKEKGVYLEIVRRFEKGVLLYVYRRERLEEELKKTENAELLARYGYEKMMCRHPDSSCKKKIWDYCLEHLKARICNSDEFPHEIGIFLGYPCEDVKGFIDHQGQNCIFSGYWKVYANPELARNLFAKFKRCVAVYEKLYSEGRSITELTVAA